MLRGLKTDTSLVSSWNYINNILSLQIMNVSVHFFLDLVQGKEKTETFRSFRTPWCARVLTKLLKTIQTVIRGVRFRLPALITFLKIYSSSSNTCDSPCNLVMAALLAGALVKTVPTNNGVPLRTWRMTVQDPETSMWKPRSVGCSQGRGVERLAGDAKNYGGKELGCVGGDRQVNVLVSGWPGPGL